MKIIDDFCESRCHEMEKFWRNKSTREVWPEREPIAIEGETLALPCAGGNDAEAMLCPFSKLPMTCLHSENTLCSHSNTQELS